MIGLDNDQITTLLGLRPVDAPAVLNGKLICFYVAQGEPADAVAKKLGCSNEQVERILASPEGTEMVIRLQTALYPDVRTRIAKITHLAVDTKFRLLMTSTSEAIKDKVATDLLDRAMGKATQVTENRNYNFDAKDAEALQRQLDAGRERLDKLATMKRALQDALPAPPKS